MKIRYVLLILVFFGLGWFQFDQLQPYLNRENAEKIRLGMTSEKVIQLMGQPDKKSILFASRVDADTAYLYRAPFGSSEEISISFDEAEKVVHVTND
ncbi:outer membrane protein assembly factor BamE domain-containing protein [Algoriphagus namhaensis]